MHIPSTCTIKDTLYCLFVILFIIVVIVNYRANKKDKIDSKLHDRYLSDVWEEE